MNEWLCRGRYSTNQLFWVNIDRGCNHLVPVCGATKNNSAFTVTVSSDYFYSTTTPVTVVGPPPSPSPSSSSSSSSTLHPLMNCDRDCTVQCDWWRLRLLK